MLIGRRRPYLVRRTGISVPMTGENGGRRPACCSTDFDVVDE